jgi:hypothetical protein
MQGISLSRNLLRLMRSAGLTELSPSKSHRWRTSAVDQGLQASAYRTVLVRQPRDGEAGTAGVGDRHRVHSFRGCALTIARCRQELFSTFRAAAPRTKLARYY